MPFSKALKILRILSKRGDSYIVGGAVRDHLLGLIPNDIDICTNVPMETIESLFPTVEIGKNKDFGIVVIKFEDETFEIAQFRTEGSYSDGRRPDWVKFVPNIEADLSRRDFTINALALDKDLTLIDPFNGKQDLEERILRTVGTAHDRFSEDYLRMLRAVRFSQKYNLIMDLSVVDAIKIFAISISKIAKERIHQELWKMASFSGEEFANCIYIMNQLGLLKYIYPEISIMKNFEHNEIHHPEGNVFNHTISALKSYSGNNPFINFSILFHDVGKPIAYEFKEGKGHTYIGHDIKGYNLIQDIAKRMKWSNKLRDIVAYCARKHMLFHQFHQMKSAKIGNLLINENFDILYEVSKSDSFSRGFDLGELDWKKVNDRLDKLKNEGITKEKILYIRKQINGDYIMKIRNIKSPCEEVGYCLQKTWDYIINHNLDLVKDEKKIEKYIYSYTYSKKEGKNERL